MNPPAVPVPEGAWAPERVTAGILAGGRATRMGGVDKGLVDLGGRAMVEYVLDALRAQSAAVLINANRSLDAYRRYGVPVVADALEGYLGPLAGVASLMAAARTDWLLIAPCDSPQVPADLGARLWQAMVRERAGIGVAHSGDHLEPAFALLPRALRTDLETYLASGERKIRLFYQQHGMAVADFSDCPEMFVNVNTLPERDQLAAQLRAPHDA